MTPEAAATITAYRTTHDVVNALSSVRCLVELLMEYPALDAGDRDRFIRMIRDQADRLVNLVARMNPDNTHKSLGRDFAKIGNTRG